ncbi:hypothetical protein BJX61DRAFT_536254 [Aspergillus egyptiacus]|nr:hypothetical protein BJX61DRAFT_536254 [Aspergillus egyptiacus]
MKLKKLPLTVLAYLSRILVLVSALIALGLNAKFLTLTAWGDQLLGYVVAIAVLSVVAALVPPYPNFLYDLFWALAALVGAVFALVIQILDSDCYEVRPESELGCATYKAGTAFTFLVALAWLGKESDARGEKGERAEESARKLKIIYAAPAFATYLLDRIPIPDVEVTLLNPRNDSIQFSLLTDIRVPDAMSVRLGPMDAQLFRPEPPGQDKTRPFATVQLPRLKFSSQEKITFVNQTFTLGDVDQFAALVEDVAYKNDFSVAAQAETKVGVAASTMTVDLVKEVTMPGFSNFPEENIRINEINVVPRDDDGNNLHSEIVFFNPAPVTVTLIINVQGDVTMAIILAEKQIGTATIAIDNLTPGNNTFSVRASLDTALVEDNIEEIIKAQIPYLRREEIIITVRGVSVVYEGEHLEYWEKALQRIEISITRPLKEILGMIVANGADFVLGGFGLEPGQQEMDAVVEELVDRILETVNGLDGEDDEDAYAERLGTLGRLALRLLRFLGVL